MSEEHSVEDLYKKTITYKHRNNDRFNYFPSGKVM